MSNLQLSLSLSLSLLYLPIYWANAQFHSYRDDPLTQLMADSLGGNAKTLMFVNVSPASSNSSETISSLTFAKRCKLVQNTSSATVETAQIRQLKKQIAAMKKQNAALPVSTSSAADESKEDPEGTIDGEVEDGDTVGELSGLVKKKSRRRAPGRRSSFIDPKLTMSAH